MTIQLIMHTSVLVNQTSSIRNSARLSVLLPLPVRPHTPTCDQIQTTVGVNIGTWVDCVASQAQFSSWTAARAILTLPQSYAHTHSTHTLPQIDKFEKHHDRLNLPRNPKDIRYERQKVA